MRFFIDTEFHWPYLLSVGVLSEDGREFYREILDAPMGGNVFLREHVFPQLHGVSRPVPGSRLGGLGEPRLACPTPDDAHACPLVRQRQLRVDLAAFVGPEPPEFWADYGAYDYVILCEALGGMDAWPESWPMYFHDLQQWRHMLGNPPMPDFKLDPPEGVTAGPHHALYDAVQTMFHYDYLGRVQLAVAEQVLDPQVKREMRRASGLVVPGSK